MVRKRLTQNDEARITSYISRDKELAGGRFIVSIATPESSFTLLTTNESRVEKELVAMAILRGTRCWNVGRRKDNAMVPSMIYNESSEFEDLSVGEQSWEFCSKISKVTSVTSWKILGISSHEPR